MDLLVESLSSSTVTATVSAMKVYLFWNTMHWGAIQFYQYFCAPKTIVGYIMSPLMTQTPHCRTAHWFQRTSTDAFNSITTLVVTWGTSFVSKWFSIKTHTN
jgi:Na+/H+ antiporter NhaC